MDFVATQSTRLPLTGNQAWQTPGLRCFGSVQELTAGGTAYSLESDPTAPPPGSPAYQFYKQ